MKLFKKIFVIFLASFLLSSCAQDSQRISLFIYDSKDPFIISLYNSIVRELYEDFKIKSYYAEGDQVLQNSDIANEIDSQRNDYLIVNIVDRMASRTILNKAKTKDIPVIFINREPLLVDINTYEKSMYVGSDPISEGKLQANLVNDYFGGVDNFYNNFDKNKNNSIDLVLIKGEQGHQDTENRSKFVVSELVNYGYHVNIVSSAYCNWSRETARNFFERECKNRLDEIDLVVSNNDEMAIGVSNYLKTLERDENYKNILESYFPIIGIDGTSSGLQSVKSKDILGTIKNDAVLQGKVIKMIIEYYENDLDFSNFPYEIEEGHFIKMKGDIITFDNLDKFI